MLNFIVNAFKAANGKDNEIDQKRKQKKTIPLMLNYLMILT
jgi:hypothetical protein